eukprot:GHVH01007400.1.p1 GENE.GHVH01007400.1~~GHVH01007400.1.p1  ORF type:complete len:313 (-),score=47.32 GHVH01007400.1:23-961(-)
MSSSSVIASNDATTLEQYRERCLLNVSRMPWRAPGCLYRHNEIYLEVVERVNSIQDVKGKIITQNVDGKIEVKAKLSGMPEVLVGINNLSTVASIPMSWSVETSHIISLNHCKLNSCVSLDKFYESHEISFIPPNSPVELMQYNSSIQPNSTLQVDPVLWELNTSILAVVVKIRNHLPSKLVVKSATIRVPLPCFHDSSSSDVYFEKNEGKVMVDDECRWLEWRIKEIKPEVELELFIQITSIRDESSLTVNDIKFQAGQTVIVDYEIPNHSASGLEILFVKVKDLQPYETTKWIRYTTLAGTIEVRTGLKP